MVEGARAQKEHVVALGARTATEGFDKFMKNVLGVQRASREAAVSVKQSMGEMTGSVDKTAASTDRSSKGMMGSLERVSKSVLGVAEASKETASSVDRSQKFIQEQLFKTETVAKEQAAVFRDEQGNIQRSMAKTGDVAKEVASVYSAEQKRMITSTARFEEEYRAAANERIHENERIIASDAEVRKNYANAVIPPGGGGGGRGAGPAAAGGAFGKDAENQAKRTTGEWKKGANTLANLGKWTTLIGAGIGIISVKWAADFQRQMELLHTQVGLTQKEVGHLSAQVLKLAPKVGEGPDALAKALYHITSNGVDAAHAMNVLEIAAKGAQIGNANLEETARALTFIWKNSPKDIHSVKEAMGVMLETVSHGDLRLEDLNKALGTGLLAAANGAKIGLRDVGAALDTLTSRGMPAQQAGTRLRTLLASMIKPTAAATRELDALGVKQGQIANDMARHGLVFALQDLQNHLSKAFPPGGHLTIDQEREAITKYGKELQSTGVGGKTLAKDLLAYKHQLEQTGPAGVKQAQAIISAFGGARMGATMLTLMQNIGDVRKHFNQMTHENAAHQVDKAWEATQKDFSVQFHEMTAGVHRLFIEVGDKLIPVIEKMVKWLVHAWGWLEKHKTILKALEILFGTVLVAAIAAFFGRLAMGIAGGLADLGKLAKFASYDLPKSFAKGVGKAIDSLGGLINKIRGVKTEAEGANAELDGMGAGGGAGGAAGGVAEGEAAGGGMGVIEGLITGVRGTEAPGSEGNPLSVMINEGNSSSLARMFGIRGATMPGSKDNPIAVVLMAGERYGVGSQAAGVGEKTEGEMRAEAAQASQVTSTSATQPKPVGPYVASGEATTAETAAAATTAEEERKLAQTEQGLLGGITSGARNFETTVGRSARNLESSVVGGAKGFTTGVSNAITNFKNGLSSAWQNLTRGRGGSLIPGTTASQAEKDAAALEGAGTANAAKMEAAMKTGGGKAAAEQESAITKGGRTAAGEQEAGVAKGGRKAAGEQEAGVAKGGRTAAGEQEAGVAKGGRKAAGEQEAAVAKGGKTAAGEQEAALSTGGKAAAGEQEAALSTGGKVAGGEIEAGMAAGGKVAAGEIETGEAAGGAAAAEEIAGAETAGGVAGAAGGAAGVAEGAGGATLLSRLKGLGGLSLTQAAIPVALAAGAANAFTSGSGISGQTYGTGLARALGPSSEQLGNAAFGVPSGFHTSSGIGDLFKSLTGSNQKIVANMSDDVKKLNDRLKGMQGFTGMSATQMNHLAAEMRRVRGEGDTTKNQREGISKLLGMLGQHQIQQMVNGIAAIKFPTEPMFVKQLNNSFKNMGPTARKQGADAMIELSRTLEQEGRLPKGSTDRLIKDIEDKYPGLREFIKATGHGSMADLNKEFRDQKTVRTVQEQVDSIKKNWGLLPHLAKTNGSNVYDNWKAALDAVTKKMHTGTAASRAAAKTEYDKLLGMQDNVTKAMVDHWANALSSMVGVSGSQFWNMSSTAIGALKAIGESTNQALRSLGLDPVRWTWAMSVSGALGQGAQQKAFAQAQSFKGRTAVGGMFPSTPGGEVIQVAEGGYPEVVLTTDPQHVDRQRKLLGQYLRMAPKAAHGVVPGYAAGGVLGAVGRTVSQISGTLTAPAGAFSDVAHAALMEFTKSVNDFIKKMGAHVPKKHAIGGIVGGPQTLGGTTGGRGLNMLGVGGASMAKAATGPQGAVDSLTHSLGNMGLTAASASKYASDHMSTNLEKMTKSVDKSLKDTNKTTRTDLSNLYQEHQKFGKNVTKNTYDTYQGGGGTATGPNVALDQTVTNTWKDVEKKTQASTDNVFKIHQQFGQNVTKDANKTYTQLNKDVDSIWKGIEKSTTTHTSNVSQTTHQSTDKMHKDTKSLYNQMFTDIKRGSNTDLSFEKGYLSNRTQAHQQGANQVATAQIKLAQASGQILSKMDTATWAGTKTVFDEMNKALGALSVKPVKVPDPGNVTSAVDQALRGVSSLAPFAAGGVLPGREFGYSDKMTLVDPMGRPRAKMAGDEAIFNRHQMPYVEAGLQMIGFHGARDLWSRVNRPHGYESGGWLGQSMGIPKFAGGGNVWEVRTSQESASSGSGWTELSPNGNAAAFLRIPRSFSNNPAHYPDFASLGKMYPRGFPLKIRSARGSGIWPLTDVGDGSSYAPAIGLTPAVSAVLGPGGTTVQITAADGSDIHPYPGMARLISGTGGFAAAGGIGGAGWSTIKSPKLNKAIGGVLRTIGQTAINKVTDAANQYGQSHMPVATGGAAGTWTGGVVPGVVSQPSGYVFPFPKGMSFQWDRIDQGQDMEESPGGPVLAIAPGTVSSRADAFSGFGPYYAVETISSGPLAGQGVYYGHTKTVKTGSVKAGDVIAVTQSHADEWTAAPAGWLEFGFSTALGQGIHNQGAAMAPILHAILSGHYARGGYLDKPKDKGEPGERPIDHAMRGMVSIGPTLDDLRRDQGWGGRFAQGGLLPGYQSGGGNAWSPLPSYVTSLPGFRPVRERRGASGIFTVGGGSGGRGTSGQGVSGTGRGTSGTSRTIHLPTSLPGKKGKKGKGATGKTGHRAHIPINENLIKILEDLGFGYLGTDQATLGKDDSRYTTMDDIFNAVSPGGLDIGHLDQLMSIREDEWDILTRDYPKIPVAVTALDHAIVTLTGQTAHYKPWPKGIPGKLQTGTGIFDPLNPPPHRSKLGQWVAGSGIKHLQQDVTRDENAISRDKKDISTTRHEIQLVNRAAATEKHNITARAMSIASDYAQAISQESDNLYSIGQARLDLGSQVLNLETQRNNLTSAKASQRISNESLSSIVNDVMSGKLPGSTKASARADDPARKAIDNELIGIRRQVLGLERAKSQIQNQKRHLASQKAQAEASLRAEGFAEAWIEQEKKWGLEDKIYKDQTQITYLEDRVKNYKSAIKTDDAQLKQEQSALDMLNVWLHGSAQGDQSMGDEFSSVGLQLIDLYMQGADLPTAGRKHPTPGDIQSTLTNILGIPVPPIVRPPAVVDWTTLSPDEQAIYDHLQYDLAQVQGGITPSDPYLGNPSIGSPPSTSDTGFPAWEASWEKIIFGDVLALWKKRLAEAQAGGASFSELTAIQDNINQSEQDLQQLAQDTGATSSVADIAAAAYQDFLNFQASRATLFTQFGSNFQPAGASAGALATAIAAGRQFYGAAAGSAAGAGALGPGLGGLVGAITENTVAAPAGSSAATPGLARGGRIPALGPGNTTITINQNFAAGPPDPHTYSQGLSYELRARM